MDVDHVLAMDDLIVLASGAEHAKHYRLFLARERQQLHVMILHRTRTAGPWMLTTSLLWTIWSSWLPAPRCTRITKLDSGVGGGPSFPWRAMEARPREATDRIHRRARLARLGAGEFSHGSCEGYWCSCTGYGFSELDG